MFRRFHSGQSSESFYLHFPWLFSVDIFNELIEGTKEQEHHQSVMLQIREQCEEDVADVALDEYIRLLRPDEWNWQQVQERVKTMIEVQLTRAEFSGSFYDMYLTLSHGDGFAAVRAEESESTGSGLLKLKKNLHDLDLSQHELGRCIKIFEGYCSAREQQWRDGKAGIYIGNLSGRVKHLETLVSGFDVSVDVTR